MPTNEPAAEHADTQAKTPRPFYLRARFIMGCLVAVVFLILVFQNLDSVDVRIFFWKQPMPAALPYIVFSLLGFVVGWILRHARAKREQEKKR